MELVNQADDDGVSACAPQRIPFNQGILLFFLRNIFRSLIMTKVEKEEGVEEGVEEGEHRWRRKREKFLPLTSGGR